MEAKTSSGSHLSRLETESYVSTMACIGSEEEVAHEVYFLKVCDYLFLCFSFSRAGALMYKKLKGSWQDTALNVDRKLLGKLAVLLGPIQSYYLSWRLSPEFLLHLLTCSGSVRHHAII